MQLPIACLSYPCPTPLLLLPSTSPANNFSSKGCFASSKGLNPDLLPYYKIGHELSVNDLYVFRGFRLIVPGTLRHAFISVAYESHQGWCEQNNYYANCTGDRKRVSAQQKKMNTYTDFRQGPHPLSFPKGGKVHILNHLHVMKGPKRYTEPLTINEKIGHST